MDSICGINCDKCAMREDCGGRPFGGSCMIAACRLEKGDACPGNCAGMPCGLKEALIKEFSDLGIEDMEAVTGLNALRGAYINLTYRLPGGQEIKFWDDSRIYLGNQLHKRGSERCYGLTADEEHLLVCEYGDGGSDAEIVVYRRRK